MTRKRIAMGNKIRAALAVAAGMVAVGLFATPVASGHEPGQCPQGQFPTSDGAGCGSVPDPTQYGCPAGDFNCMFERALPPRSQG